MFDLELEWTVEVGVGEVQGDVIFTAPPLPLSLFLTVNCPLGTNFFLSPAFHCHYYQIWRP